MAEQPKSTPELNIQVDLKGLTWGDMELLLDYDGKLSKELIGLINRVVVGGVRHMTFIDSVQPVINAIMAALNSEANPADPGPSGN